MKRDENDDKGIVPPTNGGNGRDRDYDREKDRDPRDRDYDRDRDRRDRDKERDRDRGDRRDSGEYTSHIVTISCITLFRTPSTKSRRPLGAREKERCKYWFTRLF